MGARLTVQTLAAAYGAVFLLVGVLGFVPGVTADAGDIGFAGSDSQAELLGVFQVSILHNVVHLLFGLVGLGAARALDSARSYLIGGGVIYLALFVLGIAGGLDWLPANTPDHWLHVGLGATMAGAPYVLGRPAEVAA